MNTALNKVSNDNQQWAVHIISKRMILKHCGLLLINHQDNMEPLWTKYFLSKYVWLKFYNVELDASYQTFQGILKWRWKFLSDQINGVFISKAPKVISSLKHLIKKETIKDNNVI